MGTDFIIVSGSDVKFKGAAKSVEAYNIRDDRWEILPEMNFGRDTHGSCSFNDHVLYVFCGNRYPDERCFNIIERYDTRAGEPWQVIDPGDSLPIRGDCGVQQTGPNHILIFGGYSLKTFRDAYLFLVTD